MNMKVKLLGLLVLSFCLTSPLCAVSKALNDYIANFNNEITKKEPLSFTGCFDSGSQSIEQISLYYSSSNPQDLSGARKMFVTFVEQFLVGLNQNVKLKRQLASYPFDVKGLDIIIFFRNKKGNYASSPDVGQIAMKDGDVTYYSYSKSGFKELKQESYSSAQKQVK